MPLGSRVQRVPSALTHLPHWSLIRGSWAKPTTSANPRNAGRKGPTAAACRKPMIPDFPIRAYEYYDYRHGRGQHDIRKFPGQQNSADPARFPGCCIRAPELPTENTVRGAKYINAKPVYFPKIDSRFDSDNRSGSAYRNRGDPRYRRIDDRHPGLLCF